MNKDTPLQTLKSWGLRMLTKLLVYALLGLLALMGLQLYQCYKKVSTTWQRVTLHFCTGQADYTGEFPIQGDSLVVEDICRETRMMRQGKKWVSRCIRREKVYKDKEGQEFPLRQVKGYTLHTP